MAGKTNANIGFEKQLWDAACVLWGHIPAAEYRKVIIGLIFLRYISAAFDRRYNELLEEGEGFEDDRDAYTMENVFFVPEEARWSNIAANAHTPEIGTIIDDAMRAIEAENKILKNVLPKNYASPDLDKRVLGDVVDIFTNNIDMSDAEESEDLLGRTYEYCIAQFAEKEGVGGGEFDTPASVVKTLVSILRPFDNCRVYDTIQKRIMNTHSGSIDSSWHTVVGFKFPSTISTDQLLYIENAMCEYAHANYSTCLTTSPAKANCNSTYRKQHYSLSIGQIQLCDQCIKDIKYYISIFPNTIFPSEYQKKQPAVPASS